MSRKFNKKGETMGFSGFIAVGMCVVATFAMLAIAKGAIDKAK